MNKDAAPTGPLDIWDVFRGPEHRGSVEAPRGTNRGRIETLIVDKFGVDFDDVRKREEPPRDA
jgi:hypothetical protein